MKRMLALTPLLIATAGVAQAPPGYWPPAWAVPIWRQVTSGPTPPSPSPASPSTPPSPTATPPAADSAEKRPRPPSAEEERQLAAAAMRQGNYAIAYYHWLPLAEQGDAEAQFGIGWMYHNGYGLVIDDYQTLRWWSLAAQHGHLDALFALGLLYASGDAEVVRNPRWAADLYLKAARGGHEEARALLIELLRDQGHRLGELTAGWKKEDWALLGQPQRLGANRANCRGEPDLEAAVVAVLDEGTPLIELSRRGEWVEVVVPTKALRGWLHESLLEPPAEAAPNTPRVLRPSEKLG